jgi:ABC-2 type transport system ATP-binding protein
MTASNGFFELSVASEKSKLYKLLEEHAKIDTVREEGPLIIAYLREEMKANEMNTFLFENGVSVSHLVKRKPSLEEQFLELTNNQ